MSTAEYVVATEGIDALTMRRVATRLGSSPMALYRHVKDKDELLLLMLDRLAAALDRPVLSDDPRQRLVALFRMLHDGLVAHPWVVGVLVKGELASESILWAIDEILAAFVACGLTRAQAAAAYRVVWQYTVGVLTIRHGMARAEVDRDRPGVQRAMVAAADPTRLPMVSALGADWPHPWDNYDFGLTSVLNGLLPAS